MAHSYQDLGDHLHTLAIEDEKLVRSQDFDWEELCRNVDGEEPEERTVSMSDASAAISIILGWICENRSHHASNMASVGARAESLLLLLDSNQSRYESLAQIAEAAGLTRAALSKSLLSLKDQSGLALTIGKLGGTRAKYRAAQVEAIEKGVLPPIKRTRKFG